MIDNLVIAPAERYIIDVYAPRAGSYTISNQIGDEKSYALATVLVTDDTPGQSYKLQFDTLLTDEEIVSDIDQYRQYFDKAIDKTLILDVEMKGMAG
jgi:hypothetical protein